MSSCHEKFEGVSVVEEAILNPSYLPSYMKGWRQYRIEYGFECSCPERSILVPPWVTAEQVEALFVK